MPRSGKYGTVKAGGVEITGIFSWTFNDVSENQAYADNETNGRRARVAGLGDSNGTISYRKTTAATVLVPGTTYELSLYEHKDDSNPIIVQAIIGNDSRSVVNDTGALIGHEVSWEENGGLTRGS